MECNYREAMRKAVDEISIKRVKTVLAKLLSETGVDGARLEFISLSTGEMEALIIAHIREQRAKIELARKAYRELSRKLHSQLDIMAVLSEERTRNE